jgi:tetratricopeptide (TPR) repeat protein
LDYKYALAYAYGEFGKEREAMRIYKEMIEQDDTFYEAYCQTGQILQFKYQELDSALYYYSQVVDKDEHHIDAYVNMGIAYQDKGDITNALKNYSRALAIRPEERGVLVTLNQFNETQEMAKSRARELKKKL